MIGRDVPPRSSLLSRRDIALAIVPVILASLGIVSLSRELEQAPPPRARPAQVLGRVVTPSPEPLSTLAPVAIDAGSPLPAATSPARPASTPVAVSSAPRASTRTVTRQVARPSPIDCAEHRTFCSNSGSVDIRGGRLQNVTSGAVVRNGERAPTYRATMTPMRPDGRTKADLGDECAFVRVDLSLQNETSATFVFPDGDLTLVVHKDGSESFRQARTPGGRNVRIPPGGGMSVALVAPLNGDGSYTLVGQTFYYEQ